MSKKETVWIGVIPDIFGYGICVVEKTEEACTKALRKAYNSWAKGDPDTYGPMKGDNGETLRTRFDKAMYWWGGRIQEVEFGESYYDNFGN